MNLPRLPHDPAALADFYEQALAALGALCERTWHDRLAVVAEGAGARLWNDTGALHEIELSFSPANTAAPRDAASEVFPGGPLTFRLAELLRPSPVALERIVLAGEAHPRPPAPEVAEKIWRAQFPQASRWRLTSAFQAAHHFSLVALARCEVQAIDQHWSLHRVALSLPEGARDEALAATLETAGLAPSDGGIDWPAADPTRWHALLCDALALELADDLSAIRVRQENYLRRELRRLDEYFAHYEAELSERSQTRGAKLKVEQRLAAARAEHTRRRADQIARHEIRVVPHLDALLLVAEPVWRAGVAFVRDHAERTGAALFIPRARRWAEVH